MKKYLIAAAVLVVTVAGAQAKCSTKSLNGQWMVGDDNEGIPTPLVLNNGTGTIAGGINVSLSLSKSCKGSVTLTQGAATVTGRIATERISPTSALKPNILQIGIPAQGASSGFVWTLFRL
jgi:hypothetical protein